MVSLYSRRRRCNGEYIHVGYFSNHLPSIVQDFPFRFDGSVFLFHRRISGLLRTSSSRYKPEMKSYVARRRRKKILKAEGNLLAGHPGGGFQSYFPPFSLSHTDLPRAIFSCLYIHLQQGRSWSSAQEESRSLVHTCCCGGKKKGTHFMPKMDGQKKKKTQSSHRFIHQDATYIAKISLVFLLPAHLSCNVLYTFYLMVHFVYYTDLANDAAQPDDRPLKTGLTFPILLPCASFSILIRRL